MMRLEILNVRGHYEVYAADGKFLFSADSRREVMEELEEWDGEIIV